MERSLGIFETAETLTDAYAPFNVVGVIELETGISAHGLRTALDRAQHRHPLLRARIVDPGNGWHYDLDGVPAIPLEIIEREALKSALQRHNDNRTRAARELGIHRSTLIRKIRKYNLQPRLDG